MAENTEILREIRDLLRLIAEPAIAQRDELDSRCRVKRLLEKALPDAKSRAAYQMLDGTATIDQVRTACKMSPNALVALANRCTSMGLMKSNQDKRRVSSST